MRPGLNALPDRERVFADLAVTPSSLSFGNAAAGNSGSLRLTVSNPSTLAAAASCTMLVSFTPLVAGSTGAKTASLSLGGATVPLSGTVVPTGLAIMPSATNFGSVMVGAATTATVTVTNIATSPEFVPAPTIKGIDRTQFTIYWTAAGRRLFSVALNGTTALSNFDIYAAARTNHRRLSENSSSTPTRRVRSSSSSPRSPTTPAAEELRFSGSRPGSPTPIFRARSQPSGRLGLLVQ